MLSLIADKKIDTKHIKSTVGVITLIFSPFVLHVYKHVLFFYFVFSHDLCHEFSVVYNPNAKVS